MDRVDIWINLFENNLPLKNARKIVIVGNGGIATEMVHELKNGKHGIQNIYILNHIHSYIIGQVTLKDVMECHKNFLLKHTEGGHVFHPLLAP